MEKNKKKAVFLDRDGVINKKMPPHDYVKSWEEFEFLPGIENLIRDYKQQGYLVVIVTNQRGIARGIVSEEKVKEINQRMAEELKKKGVIIDAVYYCPHNIEENCDCRKPKAGMLLRAARDLNIDLKASLLIGDSQSDIEAGKAAGCRTILFSECPAKIKNE